MFGPIYIYIHIESNTLVLQLAECQPILVLIKLGLPCKNLGQLGTALGNTACHLPTHWFHLVLSLRVRDFLFPLRSWCTRFLAGGVLRHAQLVHLWLHHRFPGQVMVTGLSSRGVEVRAGYMYIGENGSTIQN